jgi:hypothetical protein
MSDDVMIVEHGPDTRKIVTVAGRFSFADVRDGRGERRVFGCRAINPTVREIPSPPPSVPKWARGSLRILIISENSMAS